MSALFSRLKNETQEQHRELEERIDPFTSFQSPENYAAHLAQLWKFYAPFEKELTGCDLDEIGLDLTDRWKLPLLARDLLSLSITEPEVEGELGLRKKAADFMIGALYVVEGATLGGQVINRHLAQIGIGPENGGLFYQGYGNRTGMMWKDFQATASGFCSGTDQIDRAVQGARWTFDQFRERVAPETSLKK